VQSVSDGVMYVGFSFKKVRPLHGKGGIDRILITKKNDSDTLFLNNKKGYSMLHLSQGEFGGHLLIDKWSVQCIKEMDLNLLQIFMKREHKV